MDAVKVCHNVLKEGTPYLDFDLKIKKRLSVDFKDYVIIRIPCPVNTEFYQLQFEHDSDSFCVYDYSYLHKRAVSFEKCKVLPLDAHSGDTLSSSCKRALNKAAVLGGTCLLLGALWTSPVYASGNSWLDQGNYDISWYTTGSGNIYTISSEKQLAGLAYLVNCKNENMNGKVFNLDKDMDLSSKRWETISNIFKGTIEGAHRILLAAGDTFIADKNRLSGVTLENVRSNSPQQGPKEIPVQEEETREEYNSCIHLGKQIIVRDATAETDALGAEQCEYCGEILKYYDIPGTAAGTQQKNIADAILHADKQEVVVDTGVWTCFGESVADALLTRQDVALTLHYSYQGIRYTVTIPAGTDARELLDGNGYCGFRYLDKLFQGAPLEE